MSNFEELLKTENVRVRIMPLTPHETNDWHYHTEVTDDIFCLTGTILIHMQDPEEEARLSPGQRCQIKTGRIHQVENPDDSESSYLLIQGVGTYDFNVVNKGRD